MESEWIGNSRLGVTGGGNTPSARSIASDQPDAAIAC
jgi:hypothetical protein